MELTLTEMLEMQLRLWEKHRDAWDPMEPQAARNSLLWMMEELGEVIAIIKKRGEGDILTDSALRHSFTEELCDVLMYYLDVLNRYGITGEELSRAFASKHNYNMNRDFHAQHRDYNPGLEKAELS